VKKIDIVSEREPGWKRASESERERERRSDRGSVIECVKPKITMIGTQFAVNN